MTEEEENDLDIKFIDKIENYKIVLNNLLANKIIDPIDFKILEYAFYNPYFTNEYIAKKIFCNKYTVSYHLRKLEKRKFINRFYTEEHGIYKRKIEVKFI